MLSHGFGDPHRLFEIGNRENKHFGVLRAGCTQEIKPRRIAEVDGRPIAPQQVDLIHVSLEGREWLAGRREQAADNLPDATIAGNNDVVAVVLRNVKLLIHRFLVLRIRAFGEPVQQRRHHHRDGDGKHHFIHERCRQGARRTGDCEQHKGKLSTLRQNGREFECRSAVAHAEEAGERIQYQCLGQHQHGDNEQNAARNSQQQPDIHGHTHGDKEQPQQQALERRDIGFKLMAIFRIGQQHAREECAQDHRHAGRLYQQGGADYHQQRCGGKYFGNARIRGYSEHRSQQQSAADHEADQRSDHQGNLCEIDTGFERSIRAEQWQQGNEGDGRQVLEQQDGKSGATLAGCQLFLFGEHL